MRELLGKKEQLTTNLSSRQILTILTTLLYAVVEPLFQHCGLMRQLIFQAMLQTQVDHRRKISTQTKELTASLVICAVAHRDFGALRMCELDRLVLFKAADHIYTLLQKALDLEREHIRHPRNSDIIRQQMALAQHLDIDPAMMTPLVRWIKVYYDLYLQFIQLVIAKYVKFGWQEANRARALTRLHVDITELFQNYALSFLRAIGKCDTNRGTLTAYIQQWMLSARSSPEHSHQYGEAYSLPANIRKAMENRNEQLANMSTPIDDTHHNITDPDHDAELPISNDPILLACLREIPQIKVAYLSLGLPINLYPHEISALRGISSNSDHNLQNAG